MAGKTLYDKLWDAHEVKRRDDGSSLIYIDRHILHEVTSPQAFEGLRLASRQPWRIDANIATPDHNVPLRCRCSQSVWCWAWKVGIPVPGERIAAVLPLLLRSAVS